MISGITIEHNASPAKLGAVGVDGWTVWEKEAPISPWSYQQEEVCYLLEDYALGTPKGGKPTLSSLAICCAFLPVFPPAEKLPRPSTLYT